MWRIPTLFKASPFLLPFVERGNQKVITNYEIVVSRGDSWSRGQRGQILIGGTIFVGGDANPLGHYALSWDPTLSTSKIQIPPLLAFFGRFYPTP